MPSLSHPVASPIVGRDKPRLLVVSHVLPFPGISGQQQRVANTLIALRDSFEVTFVTTAPENQHAQIRERLSHHVTHPRILRSPYLGAPLERVTHRLLASCAPLFTGLKSSNYIIGSVDFAPSRISEMLEGESFDGALFEYFHAHKTARALRSRGIPVALDTHNVLWQAYERQCRSRTWMNTPLRNWAVDRYRRAEERAWLDFDLLFAINTAEAQYLRSRVPSTLPVATACMGLDLQRWPFSAQPSTTPPKLGYYGGLGSAHNAQSALQCVQKIMPLVWQKFPQTEFWIVGSSPPPSIQALTSDPRIKVTGFVERPQDILQNLTAVLCPWSGTYGFRSRLVEVMALGIPMIASTDAAYGMEFTHGEGIHLTDSLDEMAGVALRWIAHPAEVREQGAAARRSVERHYSFESTYAPMAAELARFCRTPRTSAPAHS